MVKPVRVPALAALACFACLAGCTIGVGIFPDRLMSYEGYADLAGYLDAEQVWNFSFQIIRNSLTGAEYLVLANDDRSFDGVHVAIYDANLRVLGKYTLAQLDAMGASLFNGRGAMVDVNGNIVVGNRVFSVGTRSLSGSQNPTTLGAPGLAIPGEPNPNIADIHGSGSELRYNKYSLDWTFQPPDEHPMIGGGSNYKVLCVVLHDTEVFLVTLCDGPMGEIFRIPKVAFSAGGLSEPLETYPYAFVPFPDFIAWETLGWTDQGFAAYRWDTEQYMRFDEFGVLLGTPLDATGDQHPNDQRQVYGRTAGWYTFDMKELTLERHAWWWLP